MRLALASLLLPLLPGTALSQTTTETTKLVASDAETDDCFGWNVALDGTLVLVGAHFEDTMGNDAGAAYLLETATGTELFKLTANDAAPDDWFGRDLGISGNFAVIGAPGHDGNGIDSGAAYVFDAQTGALLHKLVPSDLNPGGMLGSSVAIDGTTIILGAPFDGVNGPNSGSVYLFDALTGLQLQKIVPIGGQAGDYFGLAVDIHGSRAIIGAPGDLFEGTNSGSVLVIDVATGNQLSQFVPSDAAFGDQFGLSVAIHGSKAVVGARKPTSTFGSVYLFEVETGVETFILTSSVPTFPGFFGWSVDIYGNTAIVGARMEAAPTWGSTYVFDVTTGQEQERLIASDPNGFDGFAESCAIDGTTIIVGAPRNDDAGSASGSAYIYGTGYTPMDLGSNYCGPANSNSTGQSGSIRAFGSELLSVSEVTLIAASMPLNQFAFFLNSQTQAFVMNHSGSQGNLCLGGAIGRYSSAILHTGSSGSISLVLDLANTPTPSGATAIFAGQSWNFSTWYRDANPMLTSNFTDAVSVTFQ